MLFFLTSILSLTAIAADFIHFRRRRRRKLPVRRALVAWVAATDALPILSSLIGALSRDNGPELMYLYMWLFWAWIVTVPPRLAFYAFNFVNLRRTGYVAACAFVLFALWGTTRGRTSIRVNRVEICSDRIPEAFDGFRFVQITDMHVGTLVRPERELTRLADSVNAQRPEAVFFTGDLVNIRAGEAGRTHHGAPAADRRPGLVGHGQPRRGNLHQGFAAFPGGRGGPRSGRAPAGDGVDRPGGHDRLPATRCGQHLAHGVVVRPRAARTPPRPRPAGNGHSQGLRRSSGFALQHRPRTYPAASGNRSSRPATAI